MNVPDEVAALLRRSEESIRAAELLLREGMAGFAASRAYYAMFYAAQALLLTEGVMSHKHSGVIGEFGRLFAKTGLLSPGLHAMLIRAQERRIVGDYRALEDMPAAEAEALIADAREFLAAARDHLERHDADA